MCLREDIKIRTFSEFLELLRFFKALKHGQDVFFHYNMSVGTLRARSGMLQLKELGLYDKWTRSRVIMLNIDC